MNQSKRDGRGGPRIVVNYDHAGTWRCMLCGAAVLHVDDHYEWHQKTDRMLADSFAHVLDSEPDE